MFRAEANFFQRTGGGIVSGSWFEWAWLWIMCNFLKYLVVARRWCVAASAALNGFVGLGGLYVCVGGGLFSLLVWF